MEDKTVRVNSQDLMASEEALACYHAEYDQEVWVSMRDLYPAQRAEAEEIARFEGDLPDYDEDYSGVVIGRADSISTVVICTYEENDVHIKRWVSEDKSFLTDPPIVVKGMMTVAMNDDRILNMLCIENISKKGRAYLKLLMA